MAVPDWAKKLRQKNQEIKEVKGNYYVYEVSSKHDADKKVSVKKALNLEDSFEDIYFEEFCKTVLELVLSSFPLFCFTSLHLAISSLYFQV